MKLLSIDTTGTVASAALYIDGDLRELTADAGAKHAETLVPLMQRLLQESGVTLAQIDLFAVDVGPGSFTGVRIGVSTINAMAFALGKNVVAVNALETLYTMANERVRPVAAMIDARNGNAYAALYQGDSVLQAASAVSIDAFYASLPQGALVIGDVANADVYACPFARAVALTALKRTDEALPCVEPIYLRASQAERLRDGRAGEA